MFEDLARYPRIVVSGPHRSGTTICGEMIAADTGYQSIREEGFGLSREDQFAECLKRERVVLQAPFFSHALHYLHQFADPLLVVFMRRPLDEIRASQARMMSEQYVGGGIALYRMKQLHGESSDPAVIYENWEAQKPKIRNHLEVDYASLKKHRLWVSDRSRFHYRQTA